MQAWGQAREACSTAGSRRLWGASQGSACNRQLQHSCGEDLMCLAACAGPPGPVNAGLGPGPRSLLDRGQPQALGGIPGLSMQSMARTGGTAPNLQLGGQVRHPSLSFATYPAFHPCEQPDSRFRGRVTVVQSVARTDGTTPDLQLGGQVTPWLCRGQQ